MRVRDPEALRRWRQRRGLSQRDLAYLCRCSQATISLLERGTMPSLRDELALNLANRLQVPWEELFDPGGEMPQSQRTDEVELADGSSTTETSVVDTSVVEPATIDVSSTESPDTEG